MGAPNPRRRQYLRVFWILTAIAVVSAVIWGWKSRFEAGEAVTLPSLPRGYEPEDFWFKPDGQLVLVLRQPDQGAIAVGSWRRGDEVDEIPTQEVDLFARMPQNGQLKEVRYSLGIRAESPGRLIVPYAVSQDGLTVAAVVAGSLYVGSPSKWNEAVQVPLSPPASPVEALVFSAPNLITMVHADGSMNHCDYARRLLGTWSTRLPVAPQIWSRGSPLLISTSRTGDFGLLEVQGFDSVRTGSGLLSSPDITAAAVSSDGSRVVFSDAYGIVYLYNVRPGEFSAVFSRFGGGIPLPVSRPVRALSPLDGGELLIGGDFQDIYLLDANLKLESLAQNQGAVRLMAIQGSDLVYATPRGLIAAVVENRRRPDWFVLGWIVALFALVVSILDLYYGVYST